jgi:DNA recombination protein RmuC
MDAAVLGFLIVALAIGGVIGWLIGSRAAAASKQVVESLRLQLDEVVKERDANRSAAQDLAALRAAQDERERAFEARISELMEAKDALTAQFSEISNKLLTEAQEAFIKRADQRFRQSEESAGNNIKALLQPVHDRLQRYEDTVTKVEAERRDAFRSDRCDAHGDGTRVGRGGQTGERAQECAQSTRPLGRAAAPERAGDVRTVGALRLRD